MSTHKLIMHALLYRGADLLKRLYQNRSVAFVDHLVLSVDLLFSQDFSAALSTSWAHTGFLDIGHLC